MQLGAGRMIKAKLKRKHSSLCVMVHLPKGKNEVRGVYECSQKLYYNQIVYKQFYL